MRVSVAPDRCIGAGQCVLIAPAVFDQDDDGTVVLLQEAVAEEQFTVVREAVNVCPARVIAVELD